MSIYITFVEADGPYLKIWGQTDKNLPISIEKALKQLTPQFQHGQYAPSIENLQVGVMCCAQFKDGLYYRAKILSTAYLSQGMIEVLFMDYGNRDLVTLGSVRLMTAFTANFIALPPQAREFYLAGVTHIGSSWNEDIFELIVNEIRYNDYQFNIVGQVNNHAIISLYMNGLDMSTSFVTRGYMVSVTIPTQQMYIQSAVSKHLAQNSPTSVTQPTILTYKAMPLEASLHHKVYVSYVTDGPCLFSVQLQINAPKLKQLMEEINSSIHLLPLEELPLPGCVCLAKSLEDGYICRAVVTNTVDENLNVFYVDFGNQEVLPVSRIYQIPFKYVIPKVMATRFALAGLENTVVSLDMKCAFKNFVNDKVLVMRICPSHPGSALSLCELINEEGVSALDFVKCSALTSYPEPVALTRGFNQEIKVSYVHGCYRFYVQLKSKEKELNAMMQKLQEVCTNAPAVEIPSLKPGLPCNALYEMDGMYYRAQVLSFESDSVHVRYVDYGNEEIVTVDNVKAANVELVTTLRPQAIECCMNGYQNMDSEQERDNLFEELVLEQDFSMKVLLVQNDKILVDLFDKSQINVASLLMEKIGAKRSQTSPGVVQYQESSPEMKQIDRESPQQGYQRRSPRDGSGSKDNRNFGSQDWGSKNDRGFNNREDGDRNSYNRERSFDSKEKGFSARNRGSGSQEDNGYKRQDSWRDNKRGQNENEESSWRDSNPRYDNRKRDYDSDRRYNKNKYIKNDNSWGATSRSSPTEPKKYNRNNSETWEDRPRNNSAGGKKPNWHDNSREDRPNNDFGDRKRYKNESNTWEDRSNNDFGDRKRNREGSEKSWNGSDTGNSSRFNNRNQKFGAGKADDNRVYETETLDLATQDDRFQVLDVMSKTETVSISWFFNPNNFYCQLESQKEEFKTLMKEIQMRYKRRPEANLPAGSSVIALFSEDNALYRATVVDQSTKKVFFVDFGNTSVARKIHEIEKKHMLLPQQAIHCSIADVVAANDQWAKATDLAEYFDKDTFECSFVESDDTSYLVELSHQGVSLKDQLVAAGVARDEFAPGEQVSAGKFDINFLCGQQIRCQLASFNKMSDMLLQLQPGLFIQCSAHNLDGAEKTFETNLQEYLGNFVIAYVDNVIEEKLEVTLYDLSGQKLQLVEPDEGSFDAVPAISPCPVIYTNLSGYASHATENVVYVQPNAFAQAISDLLENLFAHYDGSVPADLVPEADGIYAVQSADGNWYRCKVTQIAEDNVTVQYFDYGNEEVVCSSQLRELDLSFYDYDMLAVNVIVDNAESLVDKEVNLTLSYNEMGWLGTLNTPVEQATAEVAEAIAVQEATPSDLPEEPTEETLTSGFSVHISHIDSPGEFYLQLHDAADAINDLQTRLQEEVADMPAIENITAGILGAAQYSVDQSWYRAHVLDADTDITTVRFVDYGNTDVLTNDTSVLKTLPPELLTMEQHSKRCSLYLQSADSEWSTEACERFQSLVGDKNITASVVHQDEKTTFVNLDAEGVNVGDVLLKENLAVELNLETSSSCTGYFSHMNSPSEFWIQLESACADLEWVSDQLTNAESFSPLEEQAPGTLCAAIFPEDDNWYRARILSNTVAGLEVIFIDYGNSCTCSSLRELPEELVMLPPLAQKCSLQKPAGLLQWSPEATELFREISADGRAIFTINKLTQGETSVVQLMLENEDVSLKLLPKTVECSFTNLTSIHDFYVRKTETEEAVTAIADKLLSAEEWPAAEEGAALVAAKFEDDQLWYRAKILNKTDDDKFEVSFVDYGNTSIASEIRKLDESLEAVEPLAIHCALDELPGHKWSEDSEQKFFDNDNYGSTVYQVEFVADNLVRLYLNGSDIRSSLSIVKCTPASSQHNTPKKTAPAPSISLNAGDVFTKEAEASISKLANEVSQQEVLTVLDELVQRVVSPEDNIVIEPEEALVALSNTPRNRSPAPSSTTSSPLAKASVQSSITSSPTKKQMSDSSSDKESLSNPTSPVRKQSVSPTKEHSESPLQSNTSTPSKNQLSPLQSNTPTPTKEQTSVASSNEEPDAATSRTSSPLANELKQTSTSNTDDEKDDFKSPIESAESSKTASPLAKELKQSSSSNTDDEQDNVNSPIKSAATSKTASPSAAALKQLSTTTTDDEKDDVISIEYAETSKTASPSAKELKQLSTSSTDDEKDDLKSPIDSVKALNQSLTSNTDDEKDDDKSPVQSPATSNTASPLTKELKQSSTYNTDDEKEDLKSPIESAATSKTASPLAKGLNQSSTSNTDDERDDVKSPIESAATSEPSSPSAKQLKTSSNSNTDDESQDLQNLDETPINTSSSDKESDVESLLSSNKASPSDKQSVLADVQQSGNSAAEHDNKLTASGASSPIKATESKSEHQVELDAKGGSVTDTTKDIIESEGTGNEVAEGDASDKSKLTAASST